jgi:YidC/Oxa1 family membrane protein insertase
MFMITKDMLIKFALFMCTFWIIDRFVMSRFRSNESCSDEVRSGQTFSAPDKKQVMKPLNHEIDFIDVRRTAQEIKSKISTSWAQLVFSSEGAALERLDFTRNVNGINVPISTIYPATERENKAFLVALDEKTPYYYTLVRESEHDQTFDLVYEGSFGDGTVRKHFVIYKEICRMDLTLELIPRHGSDRMVQARIFFPSPLMPSLDAQQTQALAENMQGCIEKKPLDQVNFNEYRVSPALFGAENRYFVHTMIADEQHFVTRAYYTKGIEAAKLVTILEGPEVKETQRWTLSWYIGPKDIEAIAPVDERLEKVLDYSGFLAPLSKLLLKLLKLLYSYVHNYGFAIILLTLLMKLLLLPFTFNGERRMKTNGKEMQRRMQYAQAKFKNDPERLRMEQAEIMRKYGMPQLLGCLPMLLQIPIFIALNRVLSNAIELYQAPFVGWITDLSSPDKYYVLPIMLALAMVGQAFMGDAQQRPMMLGVAVLLGAFATTFSTGLVLYIAASTAIGVAISMLTKQRAA